MAAESPSGEQARSEIGIGSATEERLREEIISEIQRKAPSYFFDPTKSFLAQMTRCMSLV